MLECSSDAWAFLLSVLGDHFSTVWPIIESIFLDSSVCCDFFEQWGQSVFMFSCLSFSFSIHLEKSHSWHTCEWNPFQFLASSKDLHLPDSFRFCIATHSGTFVSFKAVAANKFVHSLTTFTSRSGICGRYSIASKRYSADVPACRQTKISLTPIDVRTS